MTSMALILVLFNTIAWVGFGIYFGKIFKQQQFHIDTLAKLTRKYMAQVNTLEDKLK